MVKKWLMVTSVGCLLLTGTAFGYRDERDELFSSCRTAEIKAAASCGKALYDGVKCVSSEGMNVGSCVKAATGSVKCYKSVRDATERCHERMRESSMKGNDFGGRNGVHLNIG